MKFFYKKIIVVLCLLLSASAFASEFSYDDFAQIPILHEGRIKPLETFAQTKLLLISGKRSLSSTSANAWLAELFFEQELAYDRQIFKIHNPDLLAMLSLERRKKHRYSFNEIALPLQNIINTIQELHKRPKEQLTPVERQLVDLYLNMAAYYDLSKSLAVLVPQFKVFSPQLAAQLNLSINTEYSYLDLVKVSSALQKQMQALESKAAEKFSKDEMELFVLAHELQRTQAEVNAKMLRVIPPQWSADADEWFAPWQLVQSGRGSPQTAHLFELWRELAISYQNGDVKSWQDSAKRLRISTQQAAANFASPRKLSIEHFYNNAKLFYKSLAAYLAAFLLLMLSWTFWPNLLQKISCALLGLGAAFHLLGLTLRMIIMSCPPVSTLYESIIFVAFIAVLFSLLLELIKKNGTGILIGSIIGVILHFIGFSYASEGDTMGMLVAVLNTNFWLATHVVCITIGYGCCFVGGVFGHIYLLQGFFKPNTKRLAELYRSMFGVSLFALFFSLFGTILGGIWADQSWGRFWGWDPKENGAMLIVLWLLWLLHGLISKHIGQLGFAFGMVITNIIVALAWFGVNLLGVGLHSYGFTENILSNLMIFCGAELIFGFTFYFLLRKRSYLESC